MRNGPFPWARPGAVALRPGERVLWQDSPRTRPLAIRIYHVRAVVCYGIVLTLADMVEARLAHLGSIASLAAAIPGALATAGGLAILFLLALGSARTTRYTLTDRRLVMQFGLSLAATLSMPLDQLTGLAVRIHADGTGDVALRPSADAKLSYFKLWPFARPWRFGRPEPMLRGVPDAGVVATVLSRHIASARAAERRPAPALAA